ncbi:glycosyltransferase [Dyella sp. EPa41]|uniref:glycosyltransferase n=1 Tax=Dyella sp. EPa41 TaxID=1561194 RepID=UPI001916A9EE|nr:glycosyltransferase [Dyella sp. EPa41]
MTFESNRPTCTVLMATYNGGLHVAEQLDSVLSQEVAPRQVVVGDDNSTDNTVEVLSAAKVASCLRIIRYPQSSGGAGQNFLRLLADTDLAMSDFVAFCDQDDVWSRDKLSRAITSLNREDADGYSSAVTAFWPDGREHVLRQNSRQTDLDFLFEGAGQGCTFVLRGGFARQVQQFVRENRQLLGNIHYHDWLIYAVSRALGKRWVFDQVPSMRYRQHGGNDTGARGALAGVRKRLGLISDGWYASQIRQMMVAVSALDSTRAVIPSDFLVVWNRKSGPVRRIRLARMLVRRGRRRFSDRAVLAVSVLLGWL